MNDITTNDDKPKAPQDELPSTLPAEREEENDVTINPESHHDAVGNNVDIGPKPWKVREVLKVFWRFVKKPESTNVAVAIATIVIAIATWKTWREVQQGSAQTDKIIVADNRIATAMEGALSQSQQVLTNNIDSFHLDQRAWVGPTVIVLRDMKAPEPIDAIVTITNSGKTPAFKMRTRYFLHASDTPINVQEYGENPVEKLTGKGSINTLFPNAQMQLVPTTGSTDALGIQSVENGRKLLYLFAWIWYDDAFKRPHETRFCAQWHANGKVFAPCTEDYDYSD